MNKKSLRHSVATVSVANIAYIFIVAMSNFMLPRYCSVDTYAHIKTYTLYIGTYANFLSFGYFQGIYLFYGGSSIDDISSNEFSNKFWTFICLELPIALLVFCIGLFVQDYILILFSAGLVIINIGYYYRNFFQAIGEFRLYSIALLADTLTSFFSYIALIFIMRSNNYIYFIAMPLFFSVITVFILSYFLDTKIHFVRAGGFSLVQLKNNISSGFVLMFGGFAATLFLSIDRWFINLLMSDVSFAMYSFAVSMQNMIATLMSSITISMYNYLCKINDSCNIVRVKKIILVICYLLLSSAFVCKFIVELFLVKYVVVSDVLFILYGSQVFLTILKGVYINLYKIRREQFLYFRQTVSMIFVSFVLNFIMYIYFQNISSIAWATFLVCALWFFWCELRNKEFMFSVKEYLYIIILMAVFFVCGFFLNSIIGFVVYVLIFFVLSYMLTRESFECLLFALNLIIKKIFNFADLVLR